MLEFLTVCTIVLGVVAGVVVCLGLVLDHLRQERAASCKHVWSVKSRSYYPGGDFGGGQSISGSGVSSILALSYRSFSHAEAMEMIRAVRPRTDVLYQCELCSNVKVVSMVGKEVPNVARV